MDAKIETFEKRWNTISRETLSEVRRQYNAYSFDNEAVDKAFRDGCNEWFKGSLGPHVWFSGLEAENPVEAQKFKSYVSSIRFSQKSFSKPSMAMGYVLTVLSLAACYLLLNGLTEMGLVSKALLSIGIAVLVWYATLAQYKSKQAKTEEELVAHYRRQLDKHLNVIKTEIF